MKELKNPAPDYELVVVENFADYTKGDVITDATKIKELLDSEWSAHVVKKSKQSPEDSATS